MLANKAKATLIFEIFGAQRENSIQNVLKLLDILISEIRIENDYAEGNTLYRNQGEIKGYLALKKYIQRGLPGAAVAV